MQSEDLYVILDMLVAVRIFQFEQDATTHSQTKKQVEAEIQLAAYEALTHVLKAVVFGFSSLALNHIMENHISSSLDSEGKPVLDSLVLSFLQNINTLIAVENLVRTRRATLMNWKVLFLLPNVLFSFFFFFFCVVIVFVGMQVFVRGLCALPYSNLESDRALPFLQNFFFCFLFLLSVCSLGWQQSQSYLFAFL